MYRHIFTELMHTEPETVKQKYIFLVGNENLAYSIIACQYYAIVIDDENSNRFFSANGFVEYLRTLEFRGSDRISYTYVLCCEKRKNTTIAEYMKQECLNFRYGWMLFKDKEYLEKLDRLEELQSILDSFLIRCEGPENTDSGIPDRMMFHIMNRNGEPAGVLDSVIVEHIKKHWDLFVMNGSPYLYENGVFREDQTGSRTRKIIADFLFKEYRKAPAIKRIYDLLIDQPELQKNYTQINQQPKHYVNFLNGYFDCNTWKMIPHDITYLTVNQIPFAFNPEYSPPKSSGKETEAFLSSSLPDTEDQKTFWEYLGYCMTADTKYQKFMMIKGPGGTGKSVLISLLEHIVGLDNCVSISIQDLNKRFYATGLFGKLVNACADIPSSAMQNIDVLKKAVGEDAILFEKKGHDPMKFNSYAKLLFSANEMPLNLDDKTNAYYRRLLVLNMDHIVSDKEKDMMLKEKLRGESEYVIYKAMTALKQLIERGHFTEGKRCRESIEELYRSADSIKAFLDEMTQREVGKIIRRSELYKSYQTYCDDNDRKEHGKASFFRYMSDKGYYTKRTSSAIYYKDLRMRYTSEFLPVDPEEGIPFDNGNGQMTLDFTEDG